MARTFTRLGSDIALTRYIGTPASLELDSADSWGGLDVAVVPGGRTERRPVADVQDLGTASGRANLGQALILRLLTPRGGLAPLGHAGYGSRLVELVGRGNDETSRNLARLYTLEALAQEPRVAKVTSLSVETAAGSPDTVRIAFSVLPLGDDDPLPVGLEIGL